MRKAGLYHAVRGTLLALTLALIVFGGWWTNRATQARHLVDKLLTANIADVPDIVREMDAYRRWANRLTAPPGRQ